jgi:uncharacterized glyoxalase superfamily protein PhnB
LIFNAFIQFSHFFSPRPTFACFTALADGGQVRMPLAKTFWSPRFGMVADRFGVSWMVYVAAP